MPFVQGGVVVAADLVEGAHRNLGVGAVCSEVDVSLVHLGVLEGIPQVVGAGLVNRLF